MSPQEKIRRTIPCYESGPRRGQPINERLREIYRLLGAFKFDERELAMMEKEIAALTPARIIKRRAQENEAMR